MTKIISLSSKLFIIILLIGIVSSCSSPVKKEPTDSDKKDNSTLQEQSSNTSENNNTFVIKKLGEKIGEINLDGDKISFKVHGDNYITELKADKRKYANKNGDFLTEVKYKDGDFKVRKKDGTLLWKIKVADDKIKISDNEENKNPYEIKLADNDKAKIKKNEKEIGTARLKKGLIEITSEKHSYTIEKSKLSASYTVLLIEAIPDNIKFVIIAELLVKGK